MAGDRAFKYVGERRFVEGVPFGEWVEPGDMYISDQPLWPDDIELVEPAEEPVVVGCVSGYGCDSGEVPAVAVFTTRAAAQAFIDEYDTTVRRAEADGKRGTCQVGDYRIADDTDLLTDPPHPSVMIDGWLYLRHYVEGELPPAEWCRLLGIDPDGWRGSNALYWETPIPRVEFVRRAKRSTIQTLSNFVGWDKFGGDST